MFSRLEIKAAASATRQDFSAQQQLASAVGRTFVQGILQEETSTQYLEIDISQSLAGAYVRLLRRFNNRMQAVASHLLISESYAYRRCAHARLLAACQNPVPLPMMEEAFIPGPWRRFRLQRIPTQLAFAFDDELPL